jgi:nitrogen fixation NifU-like protein
MTERDARTLYQDVILAHGKAPHNQGPLEGATHEATAKNPLCGDRVTLRLRVVDGRIEDARFEAKGCMIAKASASLLTDAVRGLSLSAALALMPCVERSITTGEADVDPGLGALESLRGAHAFPARRACVLLPWKALESATKEARGLDEAPG